MAEVITINGKFTDLEYISKWKSSFKEYSLETALGKDSKKNVFWYSHNNEKAAISVWTSPKRTKTNPLPRVYTTLSHDEIKITIIPVLKEEGGSGEQNMIHANTVYWMTSLDVYVIIAYYNEAKLGKIGKQSTNAKEGKPSKEGTAKLESQILELASIKEQIHKIIKEKPDITIWNNEQIKKIPELLDSAIRRYRELGNDLNVPLKFRSLQNKENANIEWKQDLQKLLQYFTELEIDAQDRETKTDHKHEDISITYGNKAKFNIDCGKSRILYLTADAVDVNKGNKVIIITEAKNTTKDKFPSSDNLKDDLMKLMLFKKTDFKIDDVSYTKTLRCCLKGQGNSVEFKKKFPGFIEECNANDIELVFNNEIVK